MLCLVLLGRKAPLIVDLLRSVYGLRIDWSFGCDASRVKQLGREGICLAEFFSVKLSTEFGLEESNRDIEIWINTVERRLKVVLLRERVVRNDYNYDYS